MHHHPTDCLIAWHLSIGLDSMLEAKELPASIANLDTALAEMEAEDFAHFSDVGEDELNAKLMKDQAKSLNLGSRGVCRVM
jgi:hypothetical protein